MDLTRRKSVHVEGEVVGPLPVSDTGIRLKLTCTVPGILGKK